MNHPLQCRCGTVKGYVASPQAANRGVCYCKDCQMFAHYLGRAADILDELGGTEVIQTLPANVTFTEGRQALACIRLTQNGLLRWYADCCNTPIGNTQANFRFSFVGLVHNCLESAGSPLGNSFGPVRMHVNTGGAKGTVKSSPFALLAGIARFLLMVARARVDGGYKITPFFDIDSGAPVVTPRILSASELDVLRHAL